MEYLSSRRHALLGFAVAAAYWPGLLTAAFTPRWAVLAVGLPLVCSLDPRRLSPLIAWGVPWVLAWGTISLLASPDPLAGAQELWFCALLFGTMILGAELDSLDDVMTGFAAGLVLSLVVAVLQAESVSLLPTQTRISGLFLNSEILASTAALMFAWAVARPRWLIAVMSLILVIWSESRIGLLICAGSTAYAYAPRSWIWRAVGIAVLVMAALAAVVAWGPYKIGTAEHRFVLWIATAMATTPFGAGLGWFQAAHPVEAFAHSDVLQAAAELGLGAIPLLFIPVVALFNKQGSHADRTLFLAAMVLALVSFPLHMPATGFLAALVAGRLVARRRDLCSRNIDRREYDELRVRWPVAAGVGLSLDSGHGGEYLPVQSRSPAVAPVFDAADIQRGF